MVAKPEIDDEVIVARSAFDADEATDRMDFTLMTPDGDHWRREDLALSQHCYSEDEVRVALAEAVFHSVEVLYGTEFDVGDVGRSFFLGRKRGWALPSAEDPI